MTPNTGLFLKVHSSNYRVVGFTEEVSLEELVELGAPNGIPVMEDQGSGVLFDLQPYGLPDEPTVAQSVAAGAAVVTASGDKLLGGPQAGLICGRHDVIARLKKHPMARALRLDKMTLAALEATLFACLDETRALTEIPTLRMLTTPVAEVRERAEALAQRLREVAGRRRRGRLRRRDRTRGRRLVAACRDRDRRRGVCAIESPGRRAGGAAAHRCRAGDRRARQGRPAPDRPAHASLVSRGGRRGRRRLGELSVVGG